MRLKWVFRYQTSKNTTVQLREFYGNESEDIKPGELLPVVDQDPFDKLIKKGLARGCCGFAFNTETRKLERKKKKTLAADEPKPSEGAVVPLEEISITTADTISNVKSPSPDELDSPRESEDSKPNKENSKEEASSSSTGNTKTEKETEIETELEDDDKAPRGSLDEDKIPVIEFNPAPFQTFAHTPLVKVQYLFSMLTLEHAYITYNGRLVGILSKRRLLQYAAPIK